MKPRIILLAVLLMSSTLLSAQTIMNIHQSNGTVLQIPINTIDSITYTIPNPGNLATLTTTSASNVSAASATLGGNITADGGSTVTQRGVCYGTSTNPTTANSTTNDGSGTGGFVSNLTGLTVSTTYYVRAYATNSAGTAYGNEVSFTSTAGGGGGGIYPTGSVFCASGATAIVDVTNPTTGKIWMDRNLGAMQAATSSADVDAYGDLYQWGRFSDGHQCRTSSTTSTLSSTDQPAHSDFILEPFSPYDWLSPQNDNLWQDVNGTNNPCPSGYRIPTEAELEAERYSWSSDDAIGAFASPLKLPFSLSRSNSSGSVGGYGGGIWGSTIFSIPYSRMLSFGNGNGNVGIYNVERAYGSSVRCIKDSIANPGNWAALTTTSASNVTAASATLGGNITSNGVSTVTQRGVCYGTSTNPTTANSPTNDGSGTGSFSSNLAGLTASTIYYVRAYATNSAGTAYGNQVSFQTTATGGGGGGTYPTGSVYCNQTIMDSINGTSITVAGTPTPIVDVTNPTTGEIWMDRNLGATDAYASGDLYQWGRFSDGHQCLTSAPTSMLSSTDQPAHGDFIESSNPPYDWRTPQNDNLWQGVNGANNPCPSGYRLPTEAELEAERLSWSSNDAAGAFASPLKLLFSLSGYPFGYYWSSTVSGASSRSLRGDPSDASMEDNNRASGYSVRCIKD